MATSYIAASIEASKAASIAANLKTAIAELGGLRKVSELWLNFICTLIL